MRAFDERVLEAIEALQPVAYGNTIQAYLNKGLRWNWFLGASIGAVYAALDRLEERGLIVSEEGQECPPERGYRPRLYWFIVKTNFESRKKVQSGENRPA